MSSRALRALVALGLVALAAFFVVTRDARLGLDLRGGTQIVLQAQDTASIKVDAEATDRVLEVLRRRVDALGVNEPTLTRSGERRIIVELPGVQDPREAAEVIGRTAQLTFHAVTASEPVPADFVQPETPLDTTKPVALLDGSELLRLAPAALTGDGVKNAAAELDQFGTSWSVSISFNGRGDDAWEKLTGAAACAAPGDPARRVAIVLDGGVISSPQVDPGVTCDVGIVGGSTQITGTFSQAEAADLAALVKGGALPVPVEVVEQRTVGPTLGKGAIEASKQAAVIGLSLTALFLIVIYRLLGVLAAIALASYGLLSYGALLGMGATLTLPGLAGLLLSAGLAIDANVLVFERAREEKAAGRGLRPALVAGFRNAWSAIADSNATTLLAAGLLFQFASGPVRGFGVTLSVGVIASMVSALLVTRVLAETAIGSRMATRRPGLTGLANIGRVRKWIQARNPDLMSRRKLWLAISAGLVLFALAGIGLRGLTFGVEFTGGRLVEVSTTKAFDVEKAREVVTGAGFPRAVVQESGEGNLTVRDADLSNDDVAALITKLKPVLGDSELVRDELIGPSLGKELRLKAVIALVVALLAQLIYLAVRFRWTFGLAAVVAMLHDVVFVIGAFAWMGKTLDGVFLAAALTVIGVSVNDSIVTLDRIRETWSARRREPLEKAANQAVLDTAPRTVNTGLGAMFILAALTVLGGDTLTDFSLAVLIGLVVGTWSSAFTATPLLLVFQRWSSAPPPAAKSVRSTSTQRKKRTSWEPEGGAVI